MPEYRRDTFAITGNLLKRNGALAEADSHESCHIRLEHIGGAVVTGNTCVTGANDSGTGQVSPSWGFILHDLAECIVRDNVLRHGYLRERIVDLGGHDEQTIIADNLGSPPPPTATS